MKAQNIKAAITFGRRRRISMQLPSIVYTDLLLQHSDSSEWSSTSFFCSILVGVFFFSSGNCANEGHWSQFSSHKIFHYMKFHNLPFPFSVMQRKTNFPFDLLLKSNGHSKSIFKENLNFYTGVTLEPQELSHQVWTDFGSTLCSCVS